VCTEAMVSGGRFSEAPDSWSFGVVIWELFTRCADERPYAHVTTNEEVWQRLQRGERLAIRTGRVSVPAPVWTLAGECWQWEPPARPTMATAAERLRALVPAVVRAGAPPPVPAAAPLAAAAAASTTEVYSTARR
jgi:hypothetical protein